MKKRKCRMTDGERLTHEQAIKIRKMTDQQIDRYLNDLQTKAYEDGMERGEKEAGTTKSVNQDPRENAVAGFISHLDALSGTGNGIGKSTVYKLRKVAEKEGLLHGI
jgi:hypothetical protein